MTVRVEGDVNDYCGKGLSGGKVIVYPPRESTFKAEENIIAGNVVLYGATSGEVYLRGIAGERFCVRNSGATAVVEGVGDHGCEYMTGGRGRDPRRDGPQLRRRHERRHRLRARPATATFPTLVNTEMVELEDLSDPEDQETVLDLVRKHVEYTGSARGRWVLDNWDELIAKFVKVMPLDYKRALADMKKAASAEADKRRQVAAHG